MSNAPRTSAAREPYETPSTAAADAQMTSRINASAVLLVVIAAQFMVLLDAVVVNVALPTIQTDVGFSEESLSWILNAYTLMFGGFLLLGGRLADRLGRRRLFVLGLSLFSAASLVCGVAPSAGVLLVARGAQGLGGALVSPAALSLILTTFAEGPERNRALTVWGSVAGAGGALGLLLGGTIVQALGWRWVFFINPLIGAIILAAGLRVIPTSRAESKPIGGYDVMSASAITLSTIALVFTLINASSWAWTSLPTLGGLAVAGLLAAAFLVIEENHADALVPLRIFRNRSLAGSNATMLVMAAAPFAMFYFCTLYLQQVLGFSALQTGIAFVPLSLTITGASAVVSRLVDRFTPKLVLIAGLLISLAGFLLFTRLSSHGDFAGSVLPAMIVVGLGLGLTFVPITMAATSGVAAADSGLASGLINTTQQVGGSLGLAVLSSVATSRASDALHAGVSASGALTEGFQGGFTVGAAICAVAAVLALTLLPRQHRAPADAEGEVLALSSARCPGSPYFGHLARVAALGHRAVKAPAG